MSFSGQVRPEYMVGEGNIGYNRRPCDRLAACQCYKLFHRSHFIVNIMTQ